MTPLRQRMLEDLKIRNRSAATQKRYTDQVAAFAKHFGKSPEHLGPEQIRSYQLYLIRDKKVSASTLNVLVCALRFLYGVTLRQDWYPERVPLAKRERKLPVVLSADEVVQFFQAIKSIKYRAILACDHCGYQVVSYNSCRNRHCPKCQALAKAEWLQARRAEILPVEYYHVVFTLPELLASIALQNKRVVYNILFRRLFLEALEQAFGQSRLEFHGSIKPLCYPKRFDQLLRSCRGIEWVVYAKPPFGGPQKVLDYLARYTHRIAISNYRLLSIEDSRVRFTWRDYKHGGRRRTMTLHAHEFIRRFLLHVLPEGFMRIRYYGFLANRHRAKELQLCRAFLNVTEAVDPDTFEEQDWTVLIQTLTGDDPLCCPQCRRGRLIRVQTLSAWPSLHTRAPPRADPS